MYWCALVKRYVLQLQGESRDTEKTTRRGLLPRDPDDTVGHCIVLWTKETRLDLKQSASFLPAFSQDSNTSYSETLTRLV